ncbi:hypothetical protein ACJIZ3_024078 [Penstemon smallii]|uniref:Uncharacterized protein n=1 Tax=Penstemon smallii TaxID=265156 RepID=A0ABD3TRS7_9LAMI
MEGLIPFVYRAIVQYKSGGDAWINESPYMRLPGDSGRFSTSDVNLFRQDCGFATYSPPPSSTKAVVPTGINCKSTGHHLNNSRPTIK